jgi:acyl dehydratase
MGNGSKTGQPVQVGEILKPHEQGPISRTTLALFAGASGDHNPIHIDIDFAKKAGMTDVFAHGMLSMAYLAQFILKSIPLIRLRVWNVRFVSITEVNSIVQCTGHVTELLERNGESCARLAIEARMKDGAKTLLGEAIVALP